MNVVATLNEKLLNQPFEDIKDETFLLEHYKYVAHNYSKLENSIAVLSDLKSDKSFIFFGGLANKLDIADKTSSETIDTIWEEDIFNIIHPDDLIEKHLLELRFFHLLKLLPIKERSDYHISGYMRMRDKSGNYITIHHRMFYVCSYPSGNLWLALCLYNHSYTDYMVDAPSGIIFNSSTGEVIKEEREQYSNILSEREKEILRLIERGKISKEIADILSISKNTVDRHRQNILEKLRVKNSLEACRIAKLMNLL